MIEDTMILTLYQPKYEQALKAYYEEFKQHNEDVNQGRTISGASYTLLYIRDEDSKVIGLLNLRSGEQELGNVGYSICPSERRKGYGTALVDEAKALANMFDIKPLEAVVAKENVASIRVLENNGFSLKESRNEVLVYEFCQ